MTASKVNFDQHGTTNTAPSAVSVGRRIRELRSDSGVSLSELARRSGLGKGTLSELERGQRNPTLETLFAITTALGASLSDVLVGQEERPVAARTQGESVDARLLDRWGNDGVTEVYDVRIRARLQESEPHAVGVSETLTILTGRAEAGPASAPTVLLPGQSLTFAADGKHVYRGLDDDTTGILIMRYPPLRAGQFGSPR